MGSSRSNSSVTPAMAPSSSSTSTPACGLALAGPGRRRRLSVPPLASSQGRASRRAARAGRRPLGARADGSSGLDRRDTRWAHDDARVPGLAPRSDGVRDPRGRRSASRRRRDPIRSASRLASPNARSPDRGGTSRPACRHRRPLRKLLAVMRLIELGDRGWLEFVQGRADATLFHHPVWARLLADCYGYRPLVAALAEHGALSAGMPVIDVSRPFGGRRWVSLPFTDRCPPLLGENAGDLAAGSVELATSCKLDLLELRGGLVDHVAIHRDAAFVHHEVAVAANERENWDRLARNHRRNVRIAERAGVRIVRGVSASDTETFYGLHLRTRRRLGVPVQPRRFLRLLLDTVIGQGLGFVLTAYSGAHPVASAVFGSWNGTLIYKYSARDERFAKLKRTTCCCGPRSDGRARTGTTPSISAARTWSRNRCAASRTDGAHAKSRLRTRGYRAFRCEPVHQVSRPRCRSSSGTPRRGSAAPSASSF